MPHQPAIHDAVIHVLPAKPANPRAAGGAMGVRVMRTSGSRLMNESTFWTSWELRAMAGYLLVRDSFACGVSKKVQTMSIQSVIQKTKKERFKNWSKGELHAYVPFNHGNTADSVKSHQFFLPPSSSIIIFQSPVCLPFFLCNARIFGKIWGMRWWVLPDWVAAMVDLCGSVTSELCH